MCKKTLDPEIKIKQKNPKRLWTKKYNKKKTEITEKTLDQEIKLKQKKPKRLWTKKYNKKIDKRNNKQRVIKNKLNINNESEGVYLLYIIIKKPTNKRILYLILSI